MYILFFGWHDQYKNLDPNKIKIDEKLWKNIVTYNIEHITFTDLVTQQLILWIFYSILSIKQMFKWRKQWKWMFDANFYWWNQRHTKVSVRI